MRGVCGQRPPNHVADQILGGDFGHVATENAVAIAQDGDLIGELLQLFEPVRDVEHGRAARAQIAHQRKQPL